MCCLGYSLGDPVLVGTVAALPFLDDELTDDRPVLVVVSAARREPVSVPRSEVGSNAGEPVVADAVDAA
jgi:hypothetical protein